MTATVFGVHLVLALALVFLVAYLGLVLGLVTHDLWLDRRARRRRPSRR